MMKTSHPLAQILRQTMKEQGGRISFADFMETALYHPDSGYYMSADLTLGKHGDFTTASEMSPLYAQCFARQCQQVLETLPNSGILELGAGLGRFAGDVLRELNRLHASPQHYYIYEISPTLRQKQRALIESEYPELTSHITWLSTPPKQFKGIIIANEVLDALPVHCFQIQNGAIMERCVTSHGDEFCWQLTAPTTQELTRAGQALVDELQLPDGYESEINLKLPPFVQAVCESLTAGVILFADYGYGRLEYYHPERDRGTLTCFQGHKSHSNPLLHPGKQDITAHVDFTSVIETAATADCKLGGYTTQAAFLLNCGLADLIAEQESKLSMVDQFNLRQAVKRLTMPMEMGERVKIMALQKNTDIGLIGFRAHDRRREL